MPEDALSGFQLKEYEKTSAKWGEIEGEITGTKQVVADRQAFRIVTGKFSTWKE